MAFALGLAAAAPAAGAATTHSAVPTSSGSQRVVGGAQHGDARLRVDGAPRVRSFLRFGRIQPAGGRVVLELWALAGRPGTRVSVRLVPAASLRRALRLRGRLPWRVVGEARIGRVPGRVRVDVSAGAAAGSGMVLLLSTSSTRGAVFAARGSGHPPRLRFGVPVRPGTGSTQPGPAAPGSAVAGGSSAGTGVVPPPPPPELPPPPSIPPISTLPAASRFVSLAGSDAGTCTKAAPCRSFGRAYEVAQPGEVVEIADGAYGVQTITRDASKTGAGCSSNADIHACVVFRPATGGAVTLTNLRLGAGGRTDGPAGVMVVADRNSTIVTSNSDIFQAHESVLAGISHRNIYIAGSSDTTIAGGEVGPQLSDDGTHFEVQRVYGTNPLIVPTNLTIQGVWFHDVNTTHPTAHVDCLQIENGTNLVVRGNRFDRCGSVGLRMSPGSDSTEGPPTNVLIENNVFGYCAEIPVSPCYYGAQLGVGHNVLIRNNSSVQELQPTGAAANGSGITYIGNVSPGLACEAGVVYSHNVWSSGKCGATDKKAANLGFVSTAAADLHLLPGSPAIDAGDLASFAATDLDGVARPLGLAPDAGAYER